MRLGKRKTIIKKNSVLSKSNVTQLYFELDYKLQITLEKLYGNVDFVDERHRHRYEVNPKYVSDLESNGMIFTGQSEDGDRMEIMELKDHPYYVGVQYHPEYLSRPSKPSAPYVGFVLAASSKLNTYLDMLNGCGGSKIPYSQRNFYLNVNNESTKDLVRSVSK
jgi:CTP synthase